MGQEAGGQAQGDLLARHPKPSRRGDEDSTPTPDGIPPGTRCLRLSLRADLAELEKARKLVDQIGHLCGLSEERTFDAKVAVSEACANAIEHASSAAVVVAWLLRDRILIEITNDGGFVPGLRKDTGQRRRGLGLPLMVSLADQVHVSRLEAGVTRVSLTFLLPPGSVEPPSGLSDYLPRLRGDNGLECGMAWRERQSPHQAIFAVLEAVATAPTLCAASSALLEGARGFTGCEGGMLRLREVPGASRLQPPGEGWLPALVHSGLRAEFLRDEALIRSDECMCGRVCLGLTDPSLPFFTRGGSFLWGRAQTIAAEFEAEALGEVRGRCIAEGFESVAIFPLGGEKGPIGVLHLVDHEIEKFAETAGMIEWACRVAGRIMSKVGDRERTKVVRQAVKGLRAS